MSVIHHGGCVAYRWCGQERVYRHLGVGSFEWKDVVQAEQIPCKIHQNCMFIEGSIPIYPATPFKFPVLAHRIPSFNLFLRLLPVGSASPSPSPSPSPGATFPAMIVEVVGSALPRQSVLGL